MTDAAPADVQNGGSGAGPTIVLTMCTVVELIRKSLCWGGHDMHTLFLMSSTTVHMVRTIVGPAPLPPF